MENPKTCSRCGHPKPIEEFYLRHGRQGQQRSSWCKNCTKEAGCESRRRTREQRLKHNPRYPREIIDGKLCCCKCGEWKDQDTEFRTYKDSRGSGAVRPVSYCRACDRQRSAEWKRGHTTELTKAKAKVVRDQIRAEVLAAYGGKCACCGEAAPEFLTIDHIYNDGNNHRKGGFYTREGIAGPSLYRWLRKEGFPKGRVQILCWNCNCAKGKYGICPHQKEKTNATDV